LTHLTVPLSLPALVASAFVVSLATVAVPGPITLVASRLAISRHLSAAVWFLVGVTALDVTLFSALAAGAAPALRRVGALPVVEIIGGLTLVWGGLSSFRAASRSGGPKLQNGFEERRPLSHFMLGVLVAAGNPHYWIWWVTAGLAFVEAARSHGQAGMLWMLLALVAGVVAWYVPLLWALKHGRALLSARAERWVTHAMGAVLLVLGLALAGLGSWRFYAAHLGR
jgi:threonine/homoserine/homoserine lactone efflux protein